MARKIKSFAAETEAVELEPITFELIKGEEFECYGDVSGAVTLEFIAATSGDDASEIAKGILAYLEASMDAANWKRFNAIIKSPEHRIPIQTLSNIVSHLVEERSARNTDAS